MIHLQSNPYSTNIYAVHFFQAKKMCRLYSLWVCLFWILALLREEEHHTYLTAAKDWKLTVDLESSLKIPREICETNLRPDLIIVSRKTKHMGIVELTVPNEDRIEVSGEIKRQKYEQIAQEGRLKGWSVRIWAVEVGCRGFPAVSMSSFFKDLGYRGSDKKRAMERLSNAAEEASHSLWKASHFKEWGGQRNTSAQ